MKRNWFYFLIFLISFTLFILQVFVFEYPDGNVGMIVCMILVGAFVYSGVKLIQNSITFKEFIKQLFKVLFRM